LGGVGGTSPRSGAGDVVEDEDRAEGEPGAEGRVDAEVAALVEVRDAGDVRHALDRDEAPGFGLVRVEDSGARGGRRRRG
jgi:hypothetical protein